MSTRSLFRLTLNAISGRLAPIATAPAVGWGSRRSEIGRPLRVGHLGGQPFELPAPDVLETPPRRARLSGFVQEDGQAEALRDRRRHSTGELDALSHRRVPERDERQHVDRAHAGMRAPVRSQIDRSDGAVDQREGRRPRGCAACRPA